MHCRILRGDKLRAGRGADSVVRTDSLRYGGKRISCSARDSRCCAGQDAGRKSGDVDDQIRWRSFRLLHAAYRDVVGTFKYVIETDRRFYLANEVDLKRVDAASDFYFELNMIDVWVWDIYRTDRFVANVRVLTFKDVNVEELTGKAFNLPKELAVGE